MQPISFPRVYVRLAFAISTLLSYIYSLNIEILDARDLVCRRFENPIHIKLNYNSKQEFESYNSPKIRDSQQLCLMVNGKRCRCYEDIVYQDIQMTSNCVIDESFWLNIAMFSNDTHPIASSYPIKIPADSNGRDCLLATEEAQQVSQLLTLVLPLTLDDLSRSSILLHSLQQIPSNVIYELLVFVPDYQQSIIEVYLSGPAQRLTFPIRAIGESVLFRNKGANGWFSYAIQMAVKLLAAKIVRTDFYITLDADVILLKPFNVHSVLYNIQDSTKLTAAAAAEQGSANNNNIKPRALYEHEGRFLHHPEWWAGSERLLNITSDDPFAQGFSVTPAVLSTYGSVLTQAAVEEAMLGRLGVDTNLVSSSMEVTDVGDRCAVLSLGGEKCMNADRTSSNIDSGISTSSSSSWRNRFSNTEVTTAEREHLMDQAEMLWLSSFGTSDIWSEYTLYRVTLDHYKLFDQLHIAQQDATIDVPTAGDVYQDTSMLTSDLLSSRNPNPTPHIDNVRLHCYDVWYADQLPWRADLAFSKECNCLFSVVQSSTGVSPGAIYAQLPE